MTDNIFERAKYLKQEIEAVESEKRGIKKTYDDNESNVLVTDLCRTANDALNFKLSVLTEQFREL